MGRRYHRTVGGDAYAQSLLPSSATAAVREVLGAVAVGGDGTKVNTPGVDSFQQNLAMLMV